MKNIYKFAYDVKHATEIATRYKSQGYTIVGIEAEWGDEDLKTAYPDTDLSLSHHGKFSNNAPPCTQWQYHGRYNNNTCFIFSHFDLDAVFGWLVLEGRIPDNPDTRSLTDYIGWVDVVGPHRAHEDQENHSKWSPLILTLTAKFKIIKKMNKYNSEKILEEMSDAVSELLDKPVSYYNFNYIEYEKSAYNALEKTLSIKNKLHIFMSYSNFLSKYYISHKDYYSISDINVQYNIKKKRVSIGARTEELAKQYFGEQGVVGFLQNYFGDKSGGRLTVGGSPKNQEISYDNFLKIVNDIKKRIKDIS